MTIPFETVLEHARTYLEPERLRCAGDELRIGAEPKGGTEAVIVIPKGERRGGVAQ